MDKKHKQAETIAKPKKHYTELRLELEASYELDSWGSCGREWRQDASGLLRKCDKSQACERCKDGGNLPQTVALCRYFKGANSRECKQLEDDDLVAARLYTRTVPHISHRLNAAVRDAMHEPDEPPPEHLSMYIHLRNAVTELNGAGQYDPLYRVQKRLYGSDPRFDPEDPKQCAVATLPPSFPPSLPPSFPPSLLLPPPPLSVSLLRFTLRHHGQCSIVFACTSERMCLRTSVFSSLRECAGMRRGGSCTGKRSPQLP